MTATEFRQALRVVVNNYKESADIEGQVDVQGLKDEDIERFVKLVDKDDQGEIDYEDFFENFAFIDPVLNRLLSLLFVNCGLSPCPSTCDCCDGACTNLYFCVCLCLIMYFTKFDLGFHHLAGI